MSKDINLTLLERGTKAWFVNTDECSMMFVVIRSAKASFKNYEHPYVTYEVSRPDVNDGMYNFEVNSRDLFTSFDDAAMVLSQHIAMFTNEELGIKEDVNG